jgi:hypothetical protein
MASRRRLRIATLAFSPSCDHLDQVLAALLGQGRHRHADQFALVDGLRPRSESRMAFSTLATIGFSQGCTPMVRASIRVTLATWVIGTGSRSSRPDVIQDAGVGAAGAHLAEVGLERLEGLLHLVFGGLFESGIMP